MSLDDILKEVMKRKQAGKKTEILSDKRCQSASHRKKPPKEVKNSQKPDQRIHLWGLDCFGDYFTRREAECMALLLKGKTINGVANILKLSPRTVEYYIKNMRAKLGCKTKFELIELVYTTDFPKYAKYFEVPTDEE